jgi:hypothetical protein
VNFRAGEYRNGLTDELNPLVIGVNDDAGNMYLRHGADIFQHYLPIPGHIRSPAAVV